MVLKGQVKDGVIVLEQGATLPEGAAVRVEMIDERSSLLDRLRPFVGVIDDLPDDLAEQHDHYAPRLK